MATLTRSTSASLDASTGMFAGQITGLIAGEALSAVAAVYIKTSDGKVYQCDGTANTEPAEFVGFTPRAAAAGEPVTIYNTNARFRYGTSLSPGAALYVSATAGRLDDAATTGGLLPVAFVINSTDIVCCTNFTG